MPTMRQRSGEDDGSVPGRTISTRCSYPMQGNAVASFPWGSCRGMLVHPQSSRRRVGNRIARLERLLAKAEGDDDEVSLGLSSPERRVKRARGDDGGVKKEASSSSDESSSDSSSDAMPGSVGALDVDVAAKAVPVDAPVAQGGDS